MELEVIDMASMKSVLDVINGNAGNGNPPAQSETNFPTPFSAGEGVLGYILQIPVVQSDKPDWHDDFIFEMVTLGDLIPAIGEWDNPLHVSLFHNVSAQMKDALRTNRGLLVINAAFEGHFVLRSRIFEEIHHQCALERFDTDRVFFLSSNLEVEKSYANWVATTQYSPIRVIAVNLFEELMSLELMIKPNSFISREDAISAVRTKHFVCFNRMPHEHRQIIVSQMLKYGLDQTALISMRSPTTDIPFSSVDYNGWYDQLPDLEKDIEYLKTRTPLIIDTDDFITNHAYTHLTSVYSETLISIVNETLFMDGRGENIFYSEKTFKPIANYHPFIMANMPGALARLRELGYKTFSPFIDESYDDETNDYKRMGMILAEIRRLASLDISELRKWYTGIFPILEHNFNVLRSYTGTSDKLRHNFGM